jgi:hypothetical protein
MIDRPSLQDHRRDLRVLERLEEARRITRTEATYLTRLRCATERRLQQLRLAAEPPMLRSRSPGRAWLNPGRKSIEMVNHGAPHFGLWRSPIKFTIGPDMKLAETADIAVSAEGD